ncbi:hypothetical protein [Ligilactobacillus salitolerans]
MILWQKLPLKITAILSVNGQADGGSSRGFTVFGLPFIYAH